MIVSPRGRPQVTPTLSEALAIVAAGSLTEPAVVDLHLEPWRAMRGMGMLHVERTVSRRRRGPRRHLAAVDLTAIGWGTLDVLKRARAMLGCFEHARWQRSYLRNDLEAADRCDRAHDHCVARAIASLDAETSAGRCRHGWHPIGHHAHGQHPPMEAS